MYLDRKASKDYKAQLAPKASKDCQVRLVQQDPPEQPDHKACQEWLVQMVQPAPQVLLDR
jgi:hypothetical protein